MKKTNQIGAFILSVLVLLQAFPASAPAEGTAEYRPAEKFYSVSFGDQTYLVAAGYTITEFPDPPEEEGLFLGWYDGDTKVEPPYTPQGNVKLTPRFEEAAPEDQRTIEFMAGDGAVISLTGLFPEDCTLSVTDEQKPLPIKFMAFRSDDGPDLSTVELYTYNITLRNPDGTEFQPDGDPVTLTLRGPKFEEALGQGRSIHVTHIPDEGETEEITDLSVRQDTVSFSVDHFSVFRFTGEYDLTDWSEEIAADGVRVSLSGVMPLGAEAEADSASPELEEGKVLAAADISLFNKGVSVQPSSWQGELTVRLSSEAIAQAVQAGDEIAVFHVEADGTVTRLQDEDVTLTEEGAEFTANAFSVYVVAGYSMETTIEAGDGNTYKITLTFREDAVLPDGAVLQAEELTGEAAEDYLGRTAVFLNAGGFAYGRVFDISILDQEGTKVQPEAAVEVTVELLDVPESAETFSVVHFAEEAGASDESGKYERAEAVEAETEGNTVSFAAGSFSAYAIVAGPEPIPLGREKLTSLSELAALGAQGVYIGHVDGYYMMDTTIKDNKQRIGIEKTKPAASVPVDGAAMYFFEPVEGTDNQFYVYCEKNGVRQYVYNGGNNSLSFTDEANRTAFTAVVNDGQFTFSHDGWYWNMQGGASGTRFCSYNQAGDPNNNMYIWYASTGEDDPYHLDGLTYGLMNWAGGVAGKAMMAQSSSENTLDAKALTVMSTANNSSQLFVPNSSDISMWTFDCAGQDRYYLQSGGQYLKITAAGLSLVSEKDADCLIQVIPGTGIHAGEICLKSGNTTLTFSGTTEGGFSVGGSAGSEWLYLVNESELTDDYFRTYSASKVSVSDAGIGNGSRIIVYTRYWNEDLLKYDFYAISSDGSLVPVYESGDSIEWVGGQINTLLWNFVEYYWEGTTDPTYYYDLYNQYSQQFIAPQESSGWVLSPDSIGINLNGRRDGRYQTPIVAWDEAAYSFAGLKVEDGRIVTCPISEAMDFYFAVMQDLNVDDKITEVPTVDHTQYGITMKIKNFGTREEMSNFLGSNEGGAVTTLVQGLLSTDLSNGYPTVTSSGSSLGSLYSGAQEVNHLFIQSTYTGTGYFEYDSTQNFASLQGKNGGNFAVYKELGTYDSGGNKHTLKHGQFFPFNDLKPGVFASTNGQNLYPSTGNKPLPDSNARKYERLYSIEHDGEKADCFFGVELEASFEQTPSGLDAWGHDIIFEFTGDDDFWLYVDNELVIDLGGIHSAVPGSVNFRTGEVNVNGKKTTLRDLFYQNYIKRGHSAEEAEEYVAERFTRNSSGQWVFQDDTNHTMRIFYMERGAGASNLHMRFNLAAVKKGNVQLSKTLSGVEEADIKAEFPYQILYKKADGQEHYLTNAVPHSPQNVNYVYYKDSVLPVKYETSVRIDGRTYQDVFFLKPGEKADISFPEGVTSYRIIECGVNTDVYNSVTVNGQEVYGTPAGPGTDRKDFGIDYATTDSRPKVQYTNAVNPDALRTLSIQKHLFAENGITPIPASEDPTKFTFRLYMASEHEALDAANMQTYHVKDPQGYYCRWDKASKSFVSIGVSDYHSLSEAEKASATFHASIYGTISNIPSGYTVEIREILAGTKYRAEERPGEIPDGYSFQKYVYDTDHAREETGSSGAQGVNGTIVSGADAKVDICNLKGWGLRLNKFWSDADYMSDRDPAYFAVFIKRNDNQGSGVGDGHITLVADTVRQLKYGDKPQTLYWYFEHLEPGVDMDHYIIREVWLKGTGWTVDENGVVSGYDEHDVHAYHENAQITFAGRQKGETVPSEFTYTVHYQQGTQAEYSNVRVDTVTNERPGIVIRKIKWNSQPLPGVTFALAEDNGNVIGTFTSDEDGAVTTAFLSNNKNYTLTETGTPQGYLGLNAPLIISSGTDGKITVSSDAGSDWYVLVQALGNRPAVLTVKNRPYIFRAIKTDQSTEYPLPNVSFELHKQVTVGDVTAFDLDPMPGYENLISDVDGLIPKLDNTLPAGTYQLKEKGAPTGYQAVDNIEFTVSATGRVTLLPRHPPEVTLTESEDSADGPMIFTMTIPNRPLIPVTLKKTVSGNMGNRSEVFDFTIEAYSDETCTQKLGSVTVQRTGDQTDNLGIGSFPAGVYLKISESVSSGIDYITVAGVGSEPPVDGSTKSRRVFVFPVVPLAEGQTAINVFFVNYAHITVDTGVSLDGMPYFVLLALAVLCLAAQVLNGRWRKKKG